MDYKMKAYDDARRGFQNFVAVFPDHELAVEAGEKIVEAAFKAAEADFQAGRFSLAREKLEEFKQKFPDNGKIDKVNEFLRDIQEKPENQSQDTNGDSKEE
jgi:TolA-binding protein